MPARSNRPEPTPLSAQPFSYAALQNTTTTTPSREGTRNRGRIGRSAECRFFFFYRTSPRNRFNGFHPCHACKVCCNTPSTTSGAAALFQTQTGTGCSVSPPPVTRPFIGAQNTLPNQRATYWCTSRQPQWNSLSSEEIGPRLGASSWTRPRGVQPPPLPQPPHLSPRLDSHLFARVTFCSHSTVSRRDC